MNLTQLQIEELQQAWKEGMAEIQAFGVMHCGFAVHDITGEVALIMDADDRGDIISVLRHSTPSDVVALQAFLDGGGCNDDNGALRITAADLKGRTTIPISELLEMSREKVH
jgi:hypothetical protein